MLIEEIFDISTGETIRKPYSDEQLAEVEKSKQELAEKEAAIEAEKLKVFEAKKQILDKLGITVEEAKLLLS